MNEVSIHLVGNVASDVTIRLTRTGVPRATFRMAVNSRRFDRASDSWVDGRAQYFSVSCFRQLAENVAHSLHKGMPIVVVGKISIREVETECADRSHRERFVDVDATTVGPDLSRGTASFQRVKRESVVLSEQAAIDEAMRRGSSAA